MSAGVIEALRVRSPNAVVSSLPGLVVASVLWLVSYSRMDFRAEAEASFQQWQSLGREILEAEGISALFALHIQPPGFAVLQLVDLQLTPDSHAFLGVLYLLMVLVTLVLMVDSARTLGLSWKVASLLGLIYALVPSTVVYSLWPMTTTPTALSIALLSWGIARLRTSPVLGAMGIASGSFSAFMFRSSFTWLFCLLVAVGAIWILVRQRKFSPRSSAAIAPILVGLAAVFAVQFHYLATFGIPTTSSWAGENLAKGLSQSTELSIDGSSLSSFPSESCESSLVASLAAQAIRPWEISALASLPGCQELLAADFGPSLALTTAEKDGLYDGAWTGNFNWSPRLAASKVWTRVMTTVVLDQPQQVFLMAVGRVPSGLSIYLEAPENYSFVPVQRAVHPTISFTGVLSVFLGPVIFFSVVLFWIWIIWKRRIRGWPIPALGLFTLVLGYHVGVSLLEYGENNRFQAEVIPLMLVLGFSIYSLAASSLTSSGQQPMGSGEVREPTSPA